MVAVSIIMIATCKILSASMAEHTEYEKRKSTRYKECNGGIGTSGQYWHRCMGSRLVSAMMPFPPLGVC